MNLYIANIDFVETIVNFALTYQLEAIFVSQKISNKLRL